MPTLDNLQIRVTGDVSDIENKLKELEQQLRQFGQIKETAQLNATIKKTTESTKSLADSTRKLAQTSKHSADGISKLFSSIGRIAFYRAIRSAIKAVTEAFAEGTQNAYDWAKANGDAFAETMDTWATQSLYVKNSLGAVASTVITALMPAIVKVTDTFVDAVNMVNEFIAVLTGADTYLRANKIVTEFAESTEDAAGAQKKLNQQLMAFDELNVITTPKDRGRGNADDLQWMDAFTRTEVRDSFKPISDAVQKLKKIIDKFAPSEEFKQSVADFLAELDESFSTFSVDFVENLEEGIDQFKKGFDATFNSEDFLGNLKTSFDNILETTNKVFEKMNELHIPEAVGKFVGDALNLVAALTAFATGSAMNHTMDLLQMIEDILTFDIGGMILDPVRSLLSVIEDIVTAIASLIDPSGTLSKGISDFFNKLRGWLSEAQKAMGLNLNGYFNEQPTLSREEAEWKKEYEKGLSSEKRYEIQVNAMAEAGKIMFQDERYLALMGDDFATGGFPEMGSMFIAGEVPGQTELVGTINGRTGVASGAEITGISDAVYATGNEEAGLLRELIAAVKSNGGLGKPNAAFGRFASQSLALYKGVTG